MNMKIYIDGNINRYYVQTLCMIFFPGAKFSDSEAEGPDTPVLHLSLETSDYVCTARATITLSGKRTEGFATVDRYGESDSLSPKRAVGFAVYRAGCELFGYVPEWGILTGVRPAKFAMDLLHKCVDEKNISPQQSEDYVKKTLTEQYLVTPKKAELLTAVARNESRLLNSLEKNSCSVYVSIPFCPSRCAYCSFVSYSTKRLLSMIPEYLNRLCDDIRRVGQIIQTTGQKPVTVYIGGGTPTVLNSEQLGALLSCIHENIDMSSVREFTLEAGRPDTVTKEKLDIAVSSGVTRVSINPQTLNDDILNAIGRRHTALDFLHAYDIARNSGIGCINTDLIAGLPGESFESFTHSMDVIDSLRPENITVHTFSVKKSAELYKDEKSFSRSGGDAVKSVDYSQLKTEKSGYFPYYLYRQKNTVGNLENVGYSLAGKEGLYNIFIMEEVHSIFAVGAGAVTKLVSRDGTRIERIFMPKYPYEYLEREGETVFIDYQKKVDEFYSLLY